MYQWWGAPSSRCEHNSPSSTRQLLHALEIPASELIINQSRAHGDGIRLAQGWFTANPGPMGHPWSFPSEFYLDAQEIPLRSRSGDDRGMLQVEEGAPKAHVSPLGSSKDRLPSLEGSLKTSMDGDCRTCSNPTTCLNVILGKRLLSRGLDIMSH